MFDSPVESPINVDAWNDQEKTQGIHLCRVVQGDRGDRNPKIDLEPYNCKYHYSCRWYVTK